MSSERIVDPQVVDAILGELANIRADRDPVEVWSMIKSIQRTAETLDKNGIFAEPKYSDGIVIRDDLHNANRVKEQAVLRPDGVTIVTEYEGYMPDATHGRSPSTAQFLELIPFIDAAAVEVMKSGTDSPIAHSK